MANRNIYDMDKQKVALVLSMVGAIMLQEKMMMQQITRYQIEHYQPDILIQMSGNTYDSIH